MVREYRRRRTRTVRRKKHNLRWYIIITAITAGVAVATYLWDRYVIPCTQEDYKKENPIMKNAMPLNRPTTLPVEWLSGKLGSIDDKVTSLLQEHNPKSLIYIGELSGQRYG